MRVAKSTANHGRVPTIVPVVPEKLIFRNTILVQQLTQSLDADEWTGST
jgi:hypothetical protein